MVSLEIVKRKPTRLFEDEEEEAWRTLESKEAFGVAEALSDPLRQWVYLELGKGPLRQAELAKRASGFFKRNVTNVLMRYHLKPLEEAGLVKFELDLSASRKAKFVHRSSDLRIQLRPPLPEGRGGELGEELQKVFKVRPRMG